MRTEYKGKQVKIEITANIKSKKQYHILQELLKEDTREAIRYLESFSIRDGKTYGKIYGVRALRGQLKDKTVDKLTGKKDYYLKQFESMFDSSKNHAPTDSDRGDWLGVEIECCIPNSAVDAAGCDYYCENHDTYCCGDCDHDCESDTKPLRALGLYLEARKIKRCSVKYDGSISAPNGYFGAEVTILFKQSDREPLRQLCKALNEIDAIVNKSCGMHVHLDQRDLISPVNGQVTKGAVMRRAKSLLNCLPLFNTIIPRSRIGNTYCENGMSTLSHNSNRYFAINLTAIPKYGTIEVRLHSATTDFVKINNWIDILLLVQRSNLTDKVYYLDQFCMDLDVPERLIMYIEERQAKFQKSETTEEDQTSNQTELVA